MTALQEEIKQAVGAEIADVKSQLADIKAMIRQVMGKDKPIPLHEAAELLGCHEATLRRKIKSGELPCKRIGRKIYLERSELFTNITPK